MVSQNSLANQKDSEDPLGKNVEDATLSELSTQSRARFSKKTQQVMQLAMTGSMIGDAFKTSPQDARFGKTKLTPEFKECILKNLYGKSPTDEEPNDDEDNERNDDEDNERNDDKFVGPLANDLYVAKRVVPLLKHWRSEARR